MSKISKVHKKIFKEEFDVKDHKQRRAGRPGRQKLNEISQELYGKKFSELSYVEKDAVMVKLRQKEESKEGKYRDKRKDRSINFKEHHDPVIKKTIKQLNDKVPRMEKLFEEEKYNRVLQVMKTTRKKLDSAIEYLENKNK